MRGPETGSIVSAITHYNFIQNLNPNGLLGKKLGQKENRSTKIFETEIFRKIFIENCMENEKMRSKKSKFFIFRNFFEIEKNQKFSVKFV